MCFSNFWKIVREFDETQKKQLLAFVTGSDRIPLGGLAKLKFIIVKNGPDSDRYRCRVCELISGTKISECYIVMHIKKYYINFIIKLR